MTVSSFVVGYQSRLARLKSIALPPEIKGHLLLRQGGLDRHTQGLIFVSASGSFKLHDVVNALKGLFGLAISMPTPDTKLPNFGNSSACLPDLARCIQKVLLPLADVAHSEVTVIRSDIRKILVRSL
jgi:hypothetical protein